MTIDDIRDGVNDPMWTWRQEIPMTFTKDSPKTYRDLWTFDVPTPRVLAAAEAKLAYHRQRLTHYRDLHTAAEKDLRDNGITVQSQSNQSSQTSYAGANVSFDETKLKAIREAEAKVREHLAMVLHCEAFVAALALATTATMPLTVDDIRFFGIGSFEPTETT